MICNLFVLQVVKRKYKQEYDIAPPITFGGDHVALDIPDDGTHTDSGWEIVPLQKTEVRPRMYQVLELRLIHVLVYVDVWSKLCGG